MAFPYYRCTHHYIDPKAPALHIENLHIKHFQNPKSYALAAINLEARAGQRLALIGRNGAGKSTLLQCIAGLIPYQQGHLSIFGHPPKACQHHVSYLPQNTGIDWDFPILVEHFILTGRYVHLGWFKGPQEADYKEVEKALELLGLLPLRKRSINQLSGGERQRALLARTLIHKAQLLLLDEPLNAIDTYTQSIIEHTLDTLKREGKTVLMATHDTECLRSGFDNIIHLEEGRQKLA
jgi:ABC-type Mn2+/Zn2+ transport system ATPase subunit